MRSISFFHCHKYQAQRNELLNSISLYYTPSLHLLLQGELTLAVETNKIIFEKVQKITIETKRFWRTTLCIRPWKLFANATVTNFWSTNLVNDVSLCPLSLFSLFTAHNNNDNDDDDDDGDSDDDNNDNGGGGSDDDDGNCDVGGDDDNDNDNNNYYYYCYY